MERSFTQEQALVLASTILLTRLMLMTGTVKKHSGKKQKQSDHPTLTASQPNFYENVK